MASNLVGREVELGVILDVLTGFKSLPQVVVLTGEAGIGKTSLWSAGTDAARAAGYRVLRARPNEAETGYSFAGLTDLLETALEDVIPDLPTIQRRALEAALLIGQPQLTVDQRAVASALLNALRVLARQAPLLVAIDDVQWLDGATRAMVGFAMSRVEHERIVALLAVRGTTPGWLRQGVLEQQLVTVEVGRLSLGATHQLVHERLGLRLRRPVMIRIHEVSAGNPFYALELARALQRRGTKLDATTELPLSETLAKLVGSRLETLTPTALLIARVAASAADPTVALVEAVVGPTADEALADCVAAEVLERDGPRLRLVHPLLGSAIRSRSAPAELRVVHRRLSELVANDEERSRHLALSAHEPNEAIATALDREARSALRRGASATAAELAELALGLTPPGDSEAVRRRVLDVADRLADVGDDERATDLLERARADTPHGVDLARILIRLAALRGLTTGLHEAEALYQQALSEAGTNPGLLTEVLLRRAELARFTSDRETGLEFAQQAVRISIGARDQALRCRALAMYALLHFTAGLGVAMAELDEALQIERSIGIDLLDDYNPTDVVIHQRLWSGDVDGARELLQVRLERALARAEPEATTTCLWMLALVEWRAGNWAIASQHADTLSSLREQTGRDAMRPADEYPGAIVAAHLGRADDARGRAERALAAAATTDQLMHQAVHHHVLGFLQLSLGDPASALPHLQATARIFDTNGLREPGQRSEIGDLVEALIATGQLDEAQNILGSWEQRSRDLDRAWALAILARCRGLLSAASGDTDSALRSFEQAMLHHARCTDPFQRTRTLLALGCTQRRAKQRGAARSTLVEAIGGFEQLGAVLWAEQARSELARIGGRTSGGAELTESERRIAELVAEGKTNREVAAALFLTVHSVETALTRTYRKLGLRSRAELASRYPSRT